MPGRTHATTKPPVPGRRGRPSSLTEETTQAIIKRILNLGSYADASIAAGINVTTFQNWMAKGRADYDRDRASDYRDFFLRVEQANRNVKAILQGRVYAGSQRDPKLALKILERRWPDEWGLKIKVEDQTKRPPGSPRDRMMKRLADIEERQTKAASAIKSALAAMDPAPTD
jgi:hypothetical protein